MPFDFYVTQQIVAYVNLISKLSVILLINQSFSVYFFLTLHAINGFLNSQFSMIKIRQQKHATHPTNWWAA